MKIDKICNGIANFINKSKRTQDVLRKINDNPALFSTVGAFAVSTTLRPVATIAITKDVDDAKYGACSSIASSLVELVGGFALLKPLQKAINKSSQQLYDMEKTIFYKNKEILRNYKSVCSRVYKLPTIFATSLLRFSLVHPTSVLLCNMGLVKSKRKAEDNG